MTTTFDHPILPMPIDTQAKECDHLLLSLLIKFIIPKKKKKTQDLNQFLAQVGIEFRISHSTIINFSN